MTQFGKILKSIRIKMDLTLEEFGKLLGVSNQVVSGWEHGKYMPKEDRIEEIAKILNVSVAELKGYDQHVPPGMVLITETELKYLRTIADLVTAKDAVEKELEQAKNIEAVSK